MLAVRAKANGSSGGWPKAIPGPSGVEFNSNGLCWVVPNLIYSPWVWLRSQTQDHWVLTQDPRKMSPDARSIKLRS